MRVAALDAPVGVDLVEDVAGVVLRTDLRGRFDVILLFAVSAAALERRLAPALRALAPGGGLWLAWPKRGSGLASDLGDRAVRELGLASGLVDNKVCAIDATWSGLRFVERRAAG
jgi:hypothetical protein